MGKIAGKIFLTSKKYHSNQPPAAPSRCLQGDTRYPSNEIYLHPVKDGFGSTLALYLLIFTATGWNLSTVRKRWWLNSPGPGDVTITQNPDSEIWRDSILHSAMHSLMNSQDRDTRDRSLNDDNVLEISEPRIWSTFERLYQNMNEAFGLGDY